MLDVKSLEKDTNKLKISLQTTWNYKEKAKYFQDKIPKREIERSP